MQSADASRDRPESLQPASVCNFHELSFARTKEGWKMPKVHCTFGIFRSSTLKPSTDTFDIAKLMPLPETGGAQAASMLPAKDPARPRGHRADPHR